MVIVLELMTLDHNQNLCQHTRGVRWACIFSACAMLRFDTFNAYDNMRKSTLGACEQTGYEQNFQYSL